ncbi:hypothetical protein [Nostoc sphaeroides]|uniref:Uncharacterized protein n=1 Tax=Nostoc sphaeroides CCNUC1 TaxID=2653204 RepID=A0A5P8VX93_9NOSO|nr:hypothetical protein [Nostoc sphaeroides]QFS44994.1 hypothetical protein GXM_02469 [Nostoc sphaeroides CCNUC1]
MNKSNLLLAERLEVAATQTKATDRGLKTLILYYSGSRLGEVHL